MIWTDNETDIDLLGFEVHAKLIKNIISNISILPTTIGVFGDWGSGKSSIMKMLQNDFSQEEKTICLYINSWIFEGYDDSKSALIEIILKELLEHKKISSTVKNKLKELFNELDWLKIGKFSLKGLGTLLTGGTNLIPDVIKYLNSFSSDPTKLIELVTNGKIEETINELFQKRKEDTDGIKYVRDFRKKFEDALIKTDIEKIVILIDDLDRCSPERIIENLEAIKLFLNVNKTAFIIGADPRIVSHAIEIRYSKNYLNEEQIKRISIDYLEKIIQIPYYLPKLSDSEVKTYLTLLFCQKNLEEETFNKIIDEFKKFREIDHYSVFDKSNIIEIDGLLISQAEKDLSLINLIAPMIITNLKGNPRQIKRFLNSYLIRKELAKAANLIDILDDSILIKLMVLEYLHYENFKKLYEWQSLQKGIPNELIELESSIVKNNNLDNKYLDWKREEIIKWLNSDPKLSGVDLRDYFWLTRDKLETAIDSKQLISPKIRNIFNRLIEAPSKNIIHNILVEMFSELDNFEQNIFFNLLQQEILKKDKDDINIGFDIFIQTMLLEKFEFLPIFLKTLDLVSIENLDASIAISISDLAKKNISLNNWIVTTLEKNKNKSIIFINSLVVQRGDN